MQNQITTRGRIFIPPPDESLHIVGAWTMTSNLVSASSCKVEGHSSWHLLCLAPLLSYNLQFRKPVEQAMSSFVTVCWSVTPWQDRGPSSDAKKWAETWQKTGRERKKGGMESERGREREKFCECKFSIVGRIQSNLLYWAQINVCVWMGEWEALVKRFGGSWWC